MAFLRPVKIGVLTETQIPSVDKASCFVSKNAAFRMIRQGTHERAGRGFIRKLLSRKLNQPEGYRFAYIPEKMPPREVPNTYFQPPQSDTWRIQHRTVTFA